METKKEKSSWTEYCDKCQMFTAHIEGEGCHRCKFIKVLGKRKSS